MLRYTYTIYITVLGKITSSITYHNVLCSGKLRGCKTFSKWVTGSVALAEIIVSDNADDNDKSKNNEDDNDNRNNNEDDNDNRNNNEVDNDNNNNNEDDNDNSNNN